MKSEKTFWRKNLRIVSFVSCSSIVVLILCSIFVRLELKKKEVLFCFSLSCFSAARRISENFDDKVDPCEDFFEFSCAGWFRSRSSSLIESSKNKFKEISMKNSLILYEMVRSNSTSRSETRRKMKIFLEVCLKRSGGVESLRKILLEFGRSPLIVERWSREESRLLSTLVFCQKQKIDPFFRVFVALDDRNGKVHRIHIDVGNLFFDEFSSYRKEEIRILFGRIGSDLFSALNFSLGNIEKVFTSIEQIFQLEFDLSKIFRGQKKNKFGQNFSFDQLEKKFFSWFDLGAFFEMFFQRDRSVFQNETFVLFRPDYFLKLDAFLRFLTPEILANFFTFRIVQHFSPWVDERLENILRPIDFSRRDDDAQNELWFRCVKKTEQIFSLKTGFSQHFFSFS